MNYDDLARELPATPSADPYDELLAQDKAEAMRINAVEAPANPDVEARLQALARKYNLPAEAVRLAPEEIERKERLGRFDYDRLARELPVTSALLADGDKSKVVHDDVDNLSALERLVFAPSRAPGLLFDTLFGDMLRPAQAPATGDRISPIERDRWGAITEPLRRGWETGGNVWATMLEESGLLSGWRRQRAEAADAHGVPYSPTFEAAQAMAAGNRRAERFPVPDNVAQGMRAISGATTFGEAAGAIWDNPAAVMETTLQSLGATAPVMAAGAAGSVVAGPWGAALAGGSGSAALEYSSTLQDVLGEAGVNTSDPVALNVALNNPDLMAKARNKGLRRGVPIGMFDAITAGFAGRLLAGAAPTARSMGARAAGEIGLQAGGGAAGEASAQALTGEFKPGDILMEAIAELPTSMHEVPLNMRHGALRAQQLDAAARYRARQAEQSAQQLAQLADLAKASKVLQRDPETFQQFVAQATEGTPLETVYIDGQVLHQSGLAEQLAAVSPAVAEQLQQAVQTGGTVAIPVDEYATHIAATDMNAQLMPHLRTEADGFSQAEAQQWLDTQGEQLQADLERAQADATQDDAFRASADAVTAQVRQQLDAAARFTLQVNESYAALVGAYYATRAAALGITPEALFERRMLTVGAQGVLGADVLNQAMASQPPKGWTHITSGEDAVSMWEGKGAEAVFWTDLAGGLSQDAQDLAGYSHSLGRSTADHIRKNHGDSKAEASRGQIAVTAEDLARVPEIVTGYDAIRTDLRSEQGAQRIAYAKRYPDALVVYVEDVSRKRSDLRGVTMWKLQPSNDPRTVLDSALGVEAGKDKGPANAGPGGDALRPLSDYESDAQTPSPGSNLPDQGDTFNQGNNAPRGAFSPDRLAITLLGGADLSTFLHEGGHFFFENDLMLASEIVAAQREGASVTAGEQQLLDDVAVLLTWHGLKGQTVAEQLTEWHSMPFEERRTHHERTAESFERYLLDGKAPSIELEPYFQRFRAWLLNVYRSLTDFLSGHPEAGTLTPEVRGVFDRMLASNEAILAAEQARSMLPLFETAAQAGMAPDAWAAYQAQAGQHTQDAVQDLQARGLRDMQWLRGARSRELKKRQSEAKGLRREMAIEVRQGMMREPVYRAWRFLTAKVTDEDRLADLPAAPKTGAGPLNRETDSLLVAIAKLGGISRESAAEHLGVHKDDFRRASGVFGKPLFRKEGGLSADAMAELLASEGYLVTDENGLADLRELEELVADELGGTPRYSVFRDPALAYLDDMRPGDQAINPQELGAGRLDVGSLREMYGAPAEGQPAVWKKLSDHRMTASKGGMHPQVVADLLGFDSGDALVQALLAATPFEDEVQARVDQRMLEQHGELATPEAIERAADEAIHNEARGRMVATELAALAKATGQPKVLVDAARQYAAAAIARLEVRELRPSMHSNAQAKAARNAAAAMKKGDVQTAAAEKRNELLQHYSARAAADARDEVERGRKYLAKFDKRIGALDAEYQDQINAMLERYDLSRASLKAVDKRKSLAAWVEAQREQGLEPDIAPELLNEAQRTSWRDMTVEDFRGLLDAVRQIEHLGRLKNKLLVAAEQRDFEAVLGELVAGIAQHAGSATPEQNTPATDAEVRKLKWHQFFLSHLKVANITQRMDGGETGGPVWSFFARSAQERANWKQTKQAELTEKLMGIMRPVLARSGQFRTARVRPALGISLTQEQVFATALNMGNEGNLSRLTTGGIAGRHFTEPQLRQLIATEMTAEDLQAVQAIWDLMAELTPEAQAKHKRIYGVEMKLVEPLPLVTKHGTLRGGYYPIVYDPRGSTRVSEHEADAVAKDALRAAHTAATTRRSYTKSRMDETPYPLLLTMGGVHQGLSQVVHDLAWHEWSMDVGKMLRSKEFQDAVRENYGPDYLNSLRKWHEDIVTENVREQAGWERFGVQLRASVSSAAMGYSLLTAIQQPIGLTQSMARIGSGQVFKALAAFMGAPKAQIAQARELSAFMRNRGITRFREVADLKRQIDLTGNRLRQAHAAVAEHAFDLMGWVQTCVDVPTWHAAFEKAVAEGKDQDAAVAIADQSVIDTQGDGAIQNLSAVQRDRFGRWLTVFYSYLSSALNMTWQTAHSERSLGRKTVDLLLLTMIPATLTALIKWGVKPGDDDDDKYWKLVQQILKENISLPLSMFVGIRELSDQAASLMVGDPVFSYQGPGSFRMVAETAKLLGQVQQGELDEGMARSAINVAGSVTGLPAAQINRTVQGVQALAEGETTNPAALAFGFQRQ